MEFLDSAQSIQQQLVYHFFIHGYQALQFLQEACNPPVVHSDLHLGNWMLDWSWQEVCGFPNVVVIDFGAAMDHELASPNIFSDDRKAFYRACNKLAR